MYINSLMKTYKPLLIALALMLILGIRLAAFELEDEYTQVAETSYLQLYLDESTGRFAVLNLDSGHLCRSVPVLTPEEKETLPEGLQNILRSHFILYYTDINLEKSYEINEYHEGFSAEIELVPNGFITHYTLHEWKTESSIVKEHDYTEAEKEGKLQFSISYLLHDDYFEVSIADVSIIEEGYLFFVSIELIPYFASNRGTSDGGMLLPIGNGTYLENKERAAGYVVFFQEPIYGPDDYNFSSQRQLFATLLPEDMSLYFNALKAKPENVGSPFFGLSYKDQGIVGIITSGVEDAWMAAGQSGYVVDLNRASVKFILRRRYTGYMSRTRQIVAYQQNVIPGTRSVRYYFPSSPSLKHSDMTAIYRDYLEQERGLTSRPDNSRPLVNVRVLCGVQEKGLFAKKFLAVTTFDQVQTIIDDFVERDMTDIMITLVGWGKNGYYANAPNNYPPDRRLGGEKGLKELVEYAHGFGIKVYLEVDYTFAIRGNGGFSIRNDVLKREMEIPYSDQRGTYILSPKTAYENLAMKEIPRFKSLGIDGLSINNIGDILLGNHDRQRRTERSTSKEYYIKILELIKESGMEAMATGWNSYMFPYIDGLQQVPTFANQFFMGPEEVPFVAGLVRGHMPYFSRPLNVSENLKRETLRLLEFGISPSFELTYQDAIILRNTSYNFLFSSKYDEWMEDIAGIYKLITGDAAHLAGLEITDHKKISDDVYSTEYEDGTVVVVNYRNSGYEYEGHMIAAEGFLFLHPERK